ncbi:MAG: helix-hairpin-helix domain-containing protein [Oscillospiraceae bacterium]|nr:helix-hairpin-helix domain-containing protein [Oscillospiraceae bacterium]
MKKSIITAVCITLCFICIGVGIFIGRISSHAMPRWEAEHLTEIKPPKLNTVFDQPEYIDGKLNINVASIENLCLLPGIGEGLAQRIIDYRQTIAPFASIEEIRFVDGMGEKKFSAIQNYITIGE